MILKKRGFTIAELLITIGIIGVVAAISVPVISNIFPDNDKAQVLKANKIISEINNELLNDSSLYLSNNISRVLRNFDRPTNPNPEYASDNYTGKSKYPYLFASKISLSGDITQTPFETFRFSSTDGTNWEIAVNTNDGLMPPRGRAWPRENIIIIVDLDGFGNGADCTYNVATCTQPDQFSFDVDYNGTVTGNDFLTQAYLRNPDKLNDKKRDYEEAERLSAGNADESDNE